MPGSPWHQAGFIGGSSGFGPPSTKCQQQQQQQQKPARGLSGASSPAVLASAQMTATSAATDLHAHHHSQGQTPLVGVSDPAKEEEESKITLSKDEVRSVGGTAESSASGKQEMSAFLKIEDKASRRGSHREGGHEAGGASLGSPLSSHPSPSTSRPSAPTIERASLSSLPDQKSHSDLDFAQNDVQKIDTKAGIQMSPVSTRTGEGNASVTGTNRPGSGHGEEEMKEAVLGSGGGPAAGLTSRSTSRGSAMEQQSLRVGSGPSKRGGATDTAPASDLPRDLGAAEEDTAALPAAVKKNTSRNSQFPQRTAVRRAMSECSHLAVPTLVAGAYPVGVGGSPATPNLPNFALMGVMSAPRAPYPHVAVRRSLTVTDGAGAAPSLFMASPQLPSSPPPKRHPGSCETNFLLPVPPHAGTSNSQENENGKLSLSHCWCGYKNKNKVGEV